MGSRGGPYVYNYVSEPPGGYRGVIGIKFLPKNLEITKKLMGGVISGAEYSVGENQQYWMYAEETIPYSSEEDAKIPVGTVIPGVVLKNRGEYTGERGAIHVVTKWADGHWTLVASRNLKKASSIDQDMSPGASMNMYVAVYDHTQTRHTRHQRPVHLKIE